MHKKRFNISSILLSLIYFLLIQTSYAVNVDKIVIFGDSLSDNGNIFSMTSKASKIIPFLPIIPKNPPYYKGRFSNGPIWIEDIAVAMDVPLDDYAYGGSWAEPLFNSGLIFPFSLSAQIDMYIAASVRDYHQADHLFVIWSGSNDYVSGREDAEFATDNTVAYIKTQIDWLVNYGAKHFLVPNLIDISLAPQIADKGPEFKEAAAELVRLHNAKLTAMLKQEKIDNPDVDFIGIDPKEFMDDVLKNPAKYHFKNLTEACYGGGYWLGGVKMDPNEVAAARKANIDLDRSPALQTAYMTATLAAKGARSCKNPDEYIFWDQLHPTRVVHQMIAAVTLETLQNNGIFGASSLKKS